MRLLLGSNKLIYGQDFIRRARSEFLRLTQIIPEKGKRVWSDFSRVSLVVTHDLHDAAHAAFIQELPAGIPVAAHFHLQLGHLTRKLEDAFKAAIDRVSIGIVPARFLAQQISAVFPQIAEWKIVRNGVDGGRFRPASLDERLAFRRARKIPDNAILVAHIGALSIAKGLQVVKAFVGRLPGSRVHLLHEFPATKDVAVQKQGSLTHYLTQGEWENAKEHLHLCPCADPLGDRPIRYCDVLIHPSLREVAPLTVTESWMAGVPVIATRSTPFYEEPGVQFALHTLPFQTGVHWAPRDVVNITMSDEMADDIAYAALQHIQAMPIPNDNVRRRIAAAANAAGFESRRMTEVFEDIYVNCERKLRGSFPGFRGSS